MKFLKENMGVIVSLVLVAGIIFLVIYFLMSQEVKTDPLKGINKVGGISEQPAQGQEGAGGQQAMPSFDQPTTEQPNRPQNNMEKISKAGDTLVMNYTGRLTNGTVFDSNVDPKFNHVTPFEFTLGAGQVIAGWDEGLVGMKVGDKKTLTIPPEKGYGSRATGSIPANSTLIFEVELVGIK